MLIQSNIDHRIDNDLNEVESSILLILKVILKIKIMINNNMLECFLDRERKKDRWEKLLTK